MLFRVEPKTATETATPSGCVTAVALRHVVVVELDAVSVEAVGTRHQCTGMYKPEHFHVWCYRRFHNHSIGLVNEFVS